MFLVQEFYIKLLFWKAISNLVLPKAIYGSCLIAEDGHLLSSLITVSAFTQVAVASEFHSGTNGHRLGWSWLLLFPLTAQVLRSYPKAAGAAGKITGLLRVLATVLQMRQLFLLVGKSVWFTRSS